MFTVDNHPQPLDFADDADDQLRHAAHRYRLELGWPTAVHRDQLTVELDDDLWGLALATGLAIDLVTALHADGLSCPVVTPPGRHTVVLLEPTERLAPAFPASVHRLPSGHRVPLPPTVTAAGPVRWLTPHEPNGIRRPPARLVADTLTRLTPAPVDAVA